MPKTSRSSTTCHSRGPSSSTGTPSADVNGRSVEQLARLPAELSTATTPRLSPPSDQWTKSYNGQTFNPPEQSPPLITAASNFSTIAAPPGPTTVTVTTSHPCLCPRPYRYPLPPPSTCHRRHWPMEPTQQSPKVIWTQYSR